MNNELHVSPYNEDSGLRPKDDQIELPSGKKLWQAWRDYIATVDLR